MSDQCHTQGCHSHGQQGSGCGCSKCHCGSSCSCSCHSQEGHHHKECHWADQLLELADEAWMELLKEKIKEKILANSKGHLDQIAQTVAEANQQRWAHKMQCQSEEAGYKERVAKLFTK